MAKPKPTDPRWTVFTTPEKDGYKMIGFVPADDGPAYLLGPKTAFDFAMNLLDAVQRIAHVRGIDKDDDSRIEGSP